MQLLTRYNGTSPQTLALDAVGTLLSGNYRHAVELVWRAKSHSQTDPEVAALVEARALADLLRDIFGNPFRPVTFEPSWRSDTVTSLAEQMYESRDFSAMPILADALQDAGCDDDDVLNHCRDGSVTHARGCWVLDLALGKECGQ